METTITRNNTLQLPGRASSNVRQPQRMLSSQSANPQQISQVVSRVVSNSSAGLREPSLQGIAGHQIQRQMTNSLNRNQPQYVSHAQPVRHFSNVSGALHHAGHQPQFATQYQQPQHQYAHVAAPKNSMVDEGNINPHCSTATNIVPYTFPFKGYEPVRVSKKTKTEKNLSSDDEGGPEAVFPSVASTSQSEEDIVLFEKRIPTMMENCTYNPIPIEDYQRIHPHEAIPHDMIPSYEVRAVRTWVGKPQVFKANGMPWSASTSEQDQSQSMYYSPSDSSSTSSELNDFNASDENVKISIMGRHGGHITLSSQEQDGGVVYSKHGGYDSQGNPKKNGGYDIHGNPVRARRNAGVSVRRRVGPNDRRRVPKNASRNGSCDNSATAGNNLPKGGKFDVRSYVKNRLRSGSEDVLLLKNIEGFNADTKVNADVHRLNKSTLKNLEDRKGSKFVLMPVEGLTSSETTK